MFKNKHLCGFVQKQKAMAGLGWNSSERFQTEAGKVARFGYATPDPQSRMGVVANWNYRNTEVAAVAPFLVAPDPDPHMNPAETLQAPQYGQAAMLKHNERSLFDGGGLMSAGAVSYGGRYNRPTVERPTKRMRLGNVRYRAPSERTANTRNRLMGANYGNT